MKLAFGRCPAFELASARDSSNATGTHIGRFQFGGLAECESSLSPGRTRREEWKDGMTKFRYLLHHYFCDTSGDLLYQVHGINRHTESPSGYDFTYCTAVRICNSYTIPFKSHLA